MTPPLVTEADLAALSEGRAPVSLPLLRYLEVPAPGWTEFLRREYLADFIAEGGTKVKLLIGTAGTGKSHLLRLAAGLAREEGYLVAALDAFGTRLFPIDRLYGAVLRAVGLETLVDAYAFRAVEELGLDREAFSGRGPLLDQALRAGLGQEMTLRRSFSERVDALLRAPALDATFASAAAQAVGHRLGVFHLSDPEQDALKRWFFAEKVKLSELKSLQIYERPDRYTARDYLRSLAVFGRLAGFRGLVVCLDNLETVAHRSVATGRQRYTRAQRDEAFEALRQLIDDVDHAQSTLYLLAGRRELLEDEKAGISSYEALRLRLLQEVRSERFNPYADIVDLDFARQSGYLSAEALADWLERVRELHPTITVGEAAVTRAGRLSLRDLVGTVAACEPGS
jgi:hypothetical protein